MNEDTFAGAWKQIRGKLREQWGRLTDDDLNVIAGKREQLIGRIQERYGRTRTEAEHEVEGFWTRMQRRLADHEKYAAKDEHPKK